MEDRIAALHRAQHLIEVPNIANDPVRARILKKRIRRVPTLQGSNFPAFLQQQAGDVSADESCCTGNESSRHSTSPHKSLLQLSVSERIPYSRINNTVQSDIPFPKDYRAIKKTGLIEILNYLRRLSYVSTMPHWANDSKSTRVLAGM
jgi:hypothetical protein